MSAPAAARIADVEVPAEVRRVRDLIDRFRERQVRDGSVPGPTADDVAALRDVAAAAARVLDDLGHVNQAEALGEDVEGWIAAGLDTAPDFGHTREAFVAPEDGAPAFFAGPVLTTNSAPPVGRRFECFFVVRAEPAGFDDLCSIYPHPKNNCRSVVLLCGSAGLRVGNCLVFFPENVPSARPVTHQDYALFFFSKFRRIHETLAVPTARALLAPGAVPTASTGLDPITCYEARSVWGYLHDYHHHQGRWPFDENVALKSNWFVGLLEETKVDSLTVLTAAEDPRVPYRDEQIDMILLERLFRYPRSRVATRNFDAGTGVLLYSWMRERGTMHRTVDGLSFDRDGALTSMRDYVTAVERLEAEVTTPDEYRARALAFVREYLAEGVEKDRFAFTADQEALLASPYDAERENIRFADAEM